MTDQMYVGLVGFAYQRLTAESGQPTLLGDFKGSTFAIGPQIGWIFDAGCTEIFANLRGYKEFNIDNRVKGGGVMLTFSLPLDPLFRELRWRDMTKTSDVKSPI